MILHSSLMTFLIAVMVIWVVKIIAAITNEVVVNNLVLVVGLPLAATCATGVILGVRQTEGPIEIQLYGLQLKGGSGPVILWVVCFLAIAIAIRMLAPSN